MVDSWSRLISPVIGNESAPVARSKKEIMMQLSKPQPTPKGMATLCRPVAKSPKA